MDTCTAGRYSPHCFCGLTTDTDTVCLPTILPEPLQAAECRSADEAAEKLSLAFSAAVTDSARERLADWRDTELAERSGSGSGGGPAGSLKARLTVLRLQQDELGFR